MRSLTEKLAARIAHYRQQGLYRQRIGLSKMQGVIVESDGQRLINFSSNDYLSLNQHPLLIEAFAEGIQKYGIGSGASHLVSGHHRLHQQAEAAFADFIGAQAALLFNTGYVANLGVLGALAQTVDAIFLDKFSHASLLDAARLSGARFRRYRHLDYTHLDACLERAAGKQALVVSDAASHRDSRAVPVFFGDRRCPWLRCIRQARAWYFIAFAAYAAANFCFNLSYGKSLWLFWGFCGGQQSLHRSFVAICP